jgi:hypothetical protein
MTDCLECQWCKKAGLMSNYHCFAPCWTSAEIIQGFHMSFIGHVGCMSFKERMNNV